MATRVLASRRSARRDRSTFTPSGGSAASRQLSLAAAETLEQRQLLSTTMVNGWTEITPPSGARVVYVSTSGSDSASGLSQSSPVRTIAQGKKLIRSGAGDQLLLHRGDTFHESFGTWTASGKDASDPTVIGAYGSGARPKVLTGSQTGLSTSFGGLNNVAIIGINLDASGRGGSTPDGIVSSGKLSNLLVEDCKIEKYRNNLTFQNFLGSISNIKIRRSVIVDSYSSSSHSQGIYADGVSGILLEENTFDHNGWGNGAGQTLFNHNAYITAKSSGLTAKNNIFANGSSHGLQARPGGTVTGNAFINNAIGLSFGLVNGGGTVTPGGVSGVVNNNVFVDGHAIGSLPAGVGMEISNIRSATVSDNLFLNGHQPSRNAAINISDISGTTNKAQAVGIAGLTVANNVVYKYPQGIMVSGGVKVSSLHVSGNDFQQMTHYQAVQDWNSMSGQSWSNNRYNVPINSKSPVILNGKSFSIAAWSTYDKGARDTRVDYPDEGRTVSSYASDFVNRARSNSESSWNSQFTAAPLVSYLRAGFRGGSTSVQPVSSDPTPTSPPPTSGGTSTGIKVYIDDVKTSEGDSGYKNFTFTIRLSGKSSSTITANWETKGSSAVVGKDYVGKNGTTTFSPGVTSKTVTVSVKGDNTRESNETFFLNGLSISKAVWGDKQGVATILNDD